VAITFCYLLISEFDYRQAEHQTNKTTKQTLLLFCTIDVVANAKMTLCLYRRNGLE